MKSVRILPAVLVLAALSVAYAADGAARQQRRGNNVDRREARQEKRIEMGIAKGYLTPEEIGKLETMEKDIAALEASLKADGNLSRDEFKALTRKLNAASRCIWAEKHDTDGRQMPVFRLGRNIFARQSFTDLMGNENLPLDQAKSLVKDFRRAVTLKHKLATKDLSAEERAKLQAEYNELLNKYFEVRTPPATTRKAR